MNRQRLLFETVRTNLSIGSESSSSLAKRKFLLKDHEDFLSKLKINENLEQYEFWTSSLECVALAIQFTCCCMFCLFFCIIFDLEPSGNYQGWEIIALLSNFILLIPFIYMTKAQKSTLVVRDQDDGDSFSQTVFNQIIVTLILLGASPILRTLTLLYSNDTIISMTCILFIIHLFTHDYYFVNGRHEKYNCYLSLNCVIFISALFASRIRYSMDAFVILVVAIEMFLLFPFVRHQLRKVCSYNAKCLMNL